jgi:hypothetical protein
MSVSNHWLKCAKKKQLFKEIDEIGLEVWGEDGTLGDLFASLNDEQTDFLMNMLVRDFMADPDDMSFGVELIAP